MKIKHYRAPRAPIAITYVAPSRWQRVQARADEAFVLLLIVAALVVLFWRLSEAVP